MRNVKIGLVALLVATSLLLGFPAGTNAAPMEQRCAAGAIVQPDMAGTYVSAVHQMRVQMYPCGGAYLEWDNQFGKHYAAYVTVQRVAGEGVVAVPLPESPEKLDNSDAIGFKAAERGWIQVITVTAYGETQGIYRLRKII